MRKVATMCSGWTVPFSSLHYDEMKNKDTARGGKKNKATPMIGSNAPWDRDPHTPLLHVSFILLDFSPKVLVCIFVDYL